MSFGIVKLAKTDPLSFFRELAKEGGLNRVRYNMASSRENVFTYDVMYHEPTDSITGFRSFPEGSDLELFSISCMEYLSQVLNEAKVEFVTHVERAILERHDEAAVRLLERQHKHQLTRLRREAQAAPEEKGGLLLLATLDGVQSELDRLFEAVLTPSQIGTTGEGGESLSSDSDSFPMKAAEKDKRRSYSDDQVEWSLAAWETLRTEPEFKKETLIAKHAEFERRFHQEHPTSTTSPDIRSLRDWVNGAGRQWK